jgi:3-methylfumaryl-CoA hydratase
MTRLDVEHLRGWIGRTQHQVDAVSQRIVDCLRATLEVPDGEPSIVGRLGGKNAASGARAGSLPATLHWCLAPEIDPLSRLAEDGHSLKGAFLPPVPLSRRLWAGVDFTLHDPLRIGDRVERVSRVADVQVKTGRSGPLCFVTIAHEFATARGRAVEERHHIVYRDHTASSSADASSADEGAAQWEQRVQIDSRRLFRYSALTFNTHRIHYDIEYCRTEGYSGLLVHGPLQASLLAELAASAGGGRALTSFSFRALRPLVEPAAVIARARENAAAGLHLWMTGPDGATTLEGTAN